MATDGQAKTEGPGHKEIITKAAGVVGAATLGSRVLGYVRDMLVAQLFGATVAADAFFMAFRIPNLLRRLTAEGAMTAAFVPTYTSVMEKDGKIRAFALACNIITLLGVALMVLCAMGVIFSPWLVKVLAPGFTTSPHAFNLTMLLTRIMFPYLLFVSVAAVMMAMLNSMGRFFYPAAGSSLLNITIIVCAITLKDRFDEPTVALAIGVLLGGIAQLALQWWELKGLGWKFVPSFNLHDADARKMGLLLLPATAGMAVAEINSFVDTLVASFLPEGSVSYLYYGNRLMQFPLGVFGVAIGVAALPSMSSEVARGGAKLVELMSHALRLTLFIAFPATVGLVALAGPITNVLFERGEFTEAARNGVVIATVYFSLGLCAYSGIKVVVAAFYALKDTATPTRVAVYCMLLNVALNLALMGPMKHGGLALATSISSFVNVGWLLWILRKKIGPLDGRRIMSSTVKMTAASILMGVAALGYSAAFFSYEAPLASRIVHLGSAITIGMVVYLASALAMGCGEAKSLMARVSSKLGIKR
ncbi:MAG: murein biosynthesis integral membrane protein MurJ [Nitrospinae bacterium]|nr:murein biosynthesis integral membrane protein MurJ [Nitrospinota bacterium]